LAFVAVAEVAVVEADAVVDADPVAVDEPDADAEEEEAAESLFAALPLAFGVEAAALDDDPDPEREMVLRQYWPSFLAHMASFNGMMRYKTS
jgi:hypothetical protein